MEALQKISDPPLVDCPQCGAPSLKKLVSAVGFRLKGSGWYETDFKGDKKKNLHDSGEKKETAGDKKEGTDDKKKTESPKETKTEKTSSDTKSADKPK